MSVRINIGRQTSGGVFKGLFGNPVHERTVSAQYRTHLRKVIESHPEETAWMKRQLKKGRVLYCPGCGVGSPTCHARVIEELLGP